MTIRLQVSVDVDADPGLVWSEMTDWAGQSRWIPFTTVSIVSAHETGLGVRASALSGVRLGRVPVGLLDRFVVTGWTPPIGHTPGELEVLHLGPYFTGEGAFRVERTEIGTRVIATELFALPGGRPIEAVVRLGLPLMRLGFSGSLRTLKRVIEDRARRVGT